jgi:tellurite resistance protein TehA-like permease
MPTNVLLSEALRAMGLLYGVPVWGFAMLWLTIAAAITLKAAREHLPFSLTWWAFTFPVGTMVTGTSELATHAGSSALAWIAVALLLALIGAWLTAAANTLRGSLAGRLFLPAASLPATT